MWRPEYAEYMVEGTPGQPYGWLVQHFNIVEDNMKFRRKELQSFLQPDEIALSITNFPRQVTILIKIPLKLKFNFSCIVLYECQCSFSSVVNFYFLLKQI